jgi:hypothetical protein
VSTNDEAVQVLKEAMESPSWWTNRAQLSAREVVRRLEEQGFTVARTSEVRAGVTPVASQANAAVQSRVNAVQQAPEPDEAAEARAQDQAHIASLMAEVESSMNAVRGAREAQSESPLTDEQRESA